MRHYSRHRPARAAFRLWNVSAFHWLLALAAACLLLPPARGAPLTPVGERAVRTVVQGQLDALARDDAVKAFSFAAPNVRQAVGSPEAFLAMVQRGYPVVYRPASVAFLKAERNGDQAIQRVRMVDADGDAWMATYSLELQKDRSWRITGCNIVLSKGRMA